MSSRYRTITSQLSAMAWTIYKSEMNKISEISKVGQVILCSAVSKDGQSTEWKRQELFKEVGKWLT